MGPKNRYSNYSFEDEIDGDIQKDPNFDLDEYIRHQSHAEAHKEPAKHKGDSQFKNAALILTVIAAAFLWMNDWSVSQAWNNVFGGEEVATAPTFTVPDVPEVPAVPEVPPVPGIADAESFVVYLAQAKEMGLSEAYSNTALQSMYQADVPLSYLNDLVEAGYQEFSYPAVIAFYNTDVPLDYLNSLSENGYLQEFSYPEIIAYYSSDVPMDYLNQLRDAGYLSEFSYPAVIAYYSSGVPIDYFNQLNEAGYLSEFSYPAIIAYYNSGVTIEYLNQLRDNDLLNSMSYPEVINAFNIDDF